MAETSARNGRSYATKTHWAIVILLFIVVMGCAEMPIAAVYIWFTKPWERTLAMQMFVPYVAVVLVFLALWHLVPVRCGSSGCKGGARLQGAEYRCDTCGMSYTVW